MESGKVGYGIEKFQFCDKNFSNFFEFSQILSSCSALNIGCISEKLIYLGLGKPNLQDGSGIFEFCDVLFWTLLGPTWLNAVHVVWKFPEAVMEGSQPDTSLSSCKK